MKKGSFRCLLLGHNYDMIFPHPADSVKALDYEFECPHCKYRVHTSQEAIRDMSSTALRNAWIGATLILVGIGVYIW